MDTIGWIVLAVVVVVAVALVLALVSTRRRRTTRLREQFGEEYDRRVEHTGSERQARRDLADAQDRREGLEVRDLAPAARDGYLQHWQQVQAEFVDRPGPAVDRADDLVRSVMRDRGYPVDDFATRADMVAVDHPDVVQDYRAATEARARHHDAGTEASTEDLRRAMVHYRALFERLVGGRPTDASAGPTQHDGVDLQEAADRAEQQNGRHSR